MSAQEVYRRKKGRSVSFKLGEWMAENRKAILSVVFLLILIGGCGWFYHYFNNSDEMKNAVTPVEPTVVTMDVQLSSDKVITVPVPKVELNANEGINLAVAKYYKALSDGDVEVISQIRPGIEDLEQLFIHERSLYIEDYQSLQVYTVPGIYEDEYVAFVMTDTKIENIATPAPELTTYYVYKATDGTYLLYEAESGRIEDYELYINAMCKLEEVNDLFTKVWVTYADVIDSDPALNEFLASFPEKLQSSVGVELAKIENEKKKNEQEEEDPNLLTEPDKINRTEIVCATTTVNVRKSDSAEATRLGQVVKGTELTRLEKRDNGWSRVLYEGQEAFIKSEYLEVVRSVSDIEVIGKVTANKVVNIRSDASTAANRVGIAYPGQIFELLEETSSGWCKIIYSDDQVAYIKSEYVDIEKK